MEMSTHTHRYCSASEPRDVTQPCSSIYECSCQELRIEMRLPCWCVVQEQISHKRRPSRHDWGKFVEPHPNFFVTGFDIVDLT